MFTEIYAKKAYPAIIVGIIVGVFASLIGMMRGLAFNEYFAFFFFWVGISLMSEYAEIRIKGTLKGFVIAIFFAMPFTVMTLRSFHDDYIVYTLFIASFINGFLGMTVGYMNNLNKEKSEGHEILQKVSIGKIGISLFAGMIAGFVQLIPMTIFMHPLTSRVAAFMHWVLLSIIISFLKVKLRGWLVGLIISEIMIIPMIMMYATDQPLRLIPMMMTSGIIGATLGYVNHEYARQF